MEAHNERQHENIPRALVVQDLSCLGRCSLTVALPALSAMGVQAVPLPTAVLSTHTGGFGRPAACDLTGFLGDALAHYRSLGIRFDAVLSGYLASPAQAKRVEEALLDQTDALKVVDPAMGDHGRLYGSLPQDMPACFRPLCARADVVTPNWTELFLLCGEPYAQEPLEEARLAALCERLGAPSVVVTGAPTPQGSANAVYSRAGGLTLIPFERLPAAYPGAGDLFAAVLCGYLLRGEPLLPAVRLATRYMSRVVGETLRAGSPPREGLLLEANLPREGNLGAPAGGCPD